MFIIKKTLTNFNMFDRFQSNMLKLVKIFFYLTKSNLLLFNFRVFLFEYNIYITSFFWRSIPCQMIILQTLPAKNNEATWAEIYWMVLPDKLMFSW